MLPRIILAIIIVAFLFWLKSRFQSLPPVQRKQWLVKLATGLLVAVLLFAVVTGRMHWIGAVVAALLGFAKFGLRTLTRYFPFVFSFFGSAPFGNPVFSTPYLRVELNMKTKLVTGNILAGPHQGASLMTLTDAQLAELEQFYQQHDTRSYYLIRVLRQHAGSFTQQTQSESPRSSVHDPSYTEALQILGLENYLSSGERLTKQVVVQAHRRLMQKFHPDRGGSDYLASRINLAKEIVLRQLQ